MPADSFTQRGRVAERVPDRPGSIPKGFLAESQDELLIEMRDAARVIRYATRNVDQYEINPVGDPTVSTGFIELFSDFDRIDEIIESVLVTGPVSTAFALQLGKRSLNLLTNAQGFCLIAPIRMKLAKTDTRTLTPSAAGDWTFELMGRPDDPGRRY
jgi:hypothetical protein